MIEIYRSGSLVQRADDTARTVTEYTTDPPTVRAYTAEENAAADAQIAQSALLTDLSERIARIEAAIWPAQPDPEDPEDPSIPEWTDWNGVWPANTLLRDGGKVWRNVTSVPLTTRPTEFPGTPEQWTHLFVEVIIGTVDPDPEPTVVPWTAGESVKVGDLRTYEGTVYRCTQAHTTQAGWEPPIVPALWAPQG